MPTEGTLRMIAIGLGLPDDTFLYSDRQRKSKRRLIIELELPDDIGFTEEELITVRRKTVAFGHDILKMIKELRKNS